MLSTKNVLPKFLKTLVLASAATLSISAFASDADTSALNELSVEETIQHDNKAEMPHGEGHELTAEEAEAKAKAEMEEELRNASQQ